MSRQIDIRGRSIGDDAACYIIAEAGVNHNGDPERAHRLVDAARVAGADAVKFQAFDADQLATRSAPKAGYQVAATGEAEAQHAMLKALELRPEHHAALIAHCAEAGIQYLCTPYDEPSVELLESIDVPAYKIGSTDTTNTPFLRLIATKGRPVLLSTGLCTMDEVEAAVAALEPMRDRLAILHCTSEYPAALEDTNLRAMKTLARAFAVPVGYSDHSAGVGVAPWAVAAGACILEKHFTLDRSLPGPDHRASVEPSELAELVRTIRLVERALGDGVKRVAEGERANRTAVRKSLVTRRAIAAGETIRREDLTCKRPGGGLAPDWLDRVAGRKAAVDLAAETTLDHDSVDWGPSGDPAAP